MAARQTRVAPSAIAAHAGSLPGCRQSGPADRPVWRVDGRLVARLEDPTTLTIRVGFEDREQYVARFPETFGVPPEMERHMKMQAVLDRGNAPAIRAAITAAYHLQRRHPSRHTVPPAGLV